MEITSAESFLAYWERVRARTRAVVDCIPPARIDWSHHDGKFSFADLIRHLAATERFMFTENARGLPSRYPGHGADLAEGYEAVIAYLDRCHRESVEIIAALGPDALVSKCETPGGVRITVWKWLRAMVEHEIHHRGQIYMMLGILNVPTPPLYGLTEQQVFDSSRRNQ